MKMKCGVVQHARVRVYGRHNIEGLRNFSLYCREPRPGAWTYFKICYLPRDLDDGLHGEYGDGKYTAAGLISRCVVIAVVRVLVTVSLSLSLSLSFSLRRVTSR
jgi:hypothetical protein